MPRGHAGGREKKKAKKKVDKPLVMPESAFVSPEVEVIRKKKKSRNEEEEA